MLPGERLELTGNITTLEWVAARSGPDIERSLGYGSGRLATGYAIALLLQKPTLEDFEFDGITLRSGGRAGLPAGDWRADAQRPREHDRILREYGEAGYRRLQEATLQSVSITGPGRLVKVLPVTRNDDAIPPNIQYPPGGGGLQWKLVKPLKFLVAAMVAEDGTARTPTFNVNVGVGAPYEGRAKLMRYFCSAG